MAKVLIVDDESACRESLHLLLSFEDFEVETAANVQEALEAGRRFVPDVLIVDWMLKDTMDGIQVAEAVRAVNPELQTIVITGYPSAELAARLKGFDCTDHLEKPFRPGELVAATHKAAAHTAAVHTAAAHTAAAQKAADHCG